MKHTKGEWSQTKGIIQCKGKTIGAVNPCIVSYQEEKLGEEDEANARLIAAAPEILEALQNFVSSIDLIVQGQKDGDIPDNDKYSAYKRIQKSLTYQTARQTITKATQP